MIESFFIKKEDKNKKNENFENKKENKNASLIGELIDSNLPYIYLYITDLLPTKLNEKKTIYKMNILEKEYNNLFFYRKILIFVIVFFFTFYSYYLYYLITFYLKNPSIIFFILFFI